MFLSSFVRGLCPLLCLFLLGCQGTPEDSLTVHRNRSRTASDVYPGQADQTRAVALATSLARGTSAHESAPVATWPAEYALPPSEAGSCSIETCSPPPPCIQLVGCDPMYGCIYQPMPDGASCDDGDACSSGEFCSEATCTGGMDVCQAPELSLEAGGQLIEMEQGETRSLTTVIKVTHPAGGLIRIHNEVFIFGENGQQGLLVSSDYPSSGYVTAGSVSFVLNQAFSGQVPGTYYVFNQAFVEGTDTYASSGVQVRVLPTGGNPVLLALGAFPNGVQANTLSEVTFTAGIADFQTRPAQVLLRRGEGPSAPVVASLNDEGTGGDLLPGDGVYSAKLWVESGAAGSLRYQASARFSEAASERFSAPFDLVVSCHPTTLSPHQPASVVSDASGSRLLCNEVQVKFAPGVACQSTAEIVAQRVGGSIVGTLPGLGLHQVRLPGSCTASAVEQAVLALQQDARVQQASAVYMGTTQAVVPSDPLFGSQPGLVKIRADEAWVLARGAGILVAVVDSGANFNHPDLMGQLFNGHDFFNNDSDPSDDAGHGSHLASIIAARSNDAVGLAGLAWNSKVLAVKVSGAQGQMSSAIAAAGIMSAADRGAKIINCSLGFPTERPNGDPIDYPGLKAAIQHATDKGAIVVASAGNQGSSRSFYPCADDNVLCVAATDENDNRWLNSSYSPQVDIAAPGANILGAWLIGERRTYSGTSFAAAHVSGSLAVLWSYFPSWTAARIRQRLLTTAAPLADATLLGKGRVDLFEAVFNGSFEDGINGWRPVGTAGAVNALGPLVAQHRGKMGLLSSGPSETQVETTLDQSFTVQPGVSRIPLQFDYNFVTEEYPEFVGSKFNDNMRLVLVGPGGVTTQLAYEEVNSSVFFPVTGVDFPGGDTTVGATGWKRVTANIPVSSGPGRYSIRVRDEGDGIYDSNLLIDNIRFK